MFILDIEFENGDTVTLAVDSFDTMWEIKDFYEDQGFDVDWEYEPA